MFLRVATVAALLLAPSYAQAPQAPAKTPAADALPDAREIINRHIQAVGGRDAILAHKSMHAIGTLSVPASGIGGPVEIFGATAPDRVVVKTTVTGIGEIAEGFDGSHAWSVSPMTGPMLQGRQGADAGEARRGLLQRAARSEEVSSRRRRLRRRTSTDVPATRSASRESTASKTSTSTTSRPGFAPAASTPASLPWER